MGDEGLWPGSIHSSHGWNFVLERRSWGHCSVTALFIPLPFSSELWCPSACKLQFPAHKHVMHSNVLYLMVKFVCILRSHRKLSCCLFWLASALEMKSYVIELNWIIIIQFKINFYAICLPTNCDQWLPKVNLTYVALYWAYWCFSLACLLHCPGLCWSLVTSWTRGISSETSSAFLPLLSL